MSTDKANIYWRLLNRVSTSLTEIPSHTRLFLERGLEAW